MKRKHLKISFWIVTAIFCLVNFLSGIAELFPNQQAIDGLVYLGYPVYLLTILGFAKILGSLAIIQQKYKTIKEWAYAGFTFDYIGAALSFFFVGGGFVELFLPVVFLGVLFLSYYLWKQVERKKK